MQTGPGVWKSEMLLMPLGVDVQNGKERFGDELVRESEYKKKTLIGFFRVRVQELEFRNQVIGYI